MKKLLLLAIALLLVFGSQVRSAETVDVVIGPQAAKLERFAAKELAGQFERLFEVTTAVHTSPPQGAKHLVLIGNPQSNPAIGKVLDEAWPKLTDQGIVLRSFNKAGQQGVVVGGGSPVATLWAAYELGHRFGIRSLPRADIYPENSLPLKLDGVDVVMEPNMRVRTWRTINDFPIGPESWGLEEHKRLLGQLAKMKFNRVMLSVYPWQPFVHYECRGVKKQTALLWFGDQYNIEPEMPGRRAFGGAKKFENPAFVGKTTYQEKIDAGVGLASGIIETAHELGMTVGLSISPLEFPKEFAAALPGSKPARGLNNLTITPSGSQGLDDSALKELTTARIRAYLETYPELDLLYLTLPEFPEWGEHAEEAWRRLNDQGQLDKLPLAQLLQSAAKRNAIASGDRGVQAIKGNLAALAFFKDLFADEDLLKRPDGRSVELVLTAVDPALAPVMDRVLPKGASMLHFLDYTARRIAENPQALEQIPAKKVASSLIFTLADDNVGVLSQSTTNRLHTLMTKMRENGWEGFSTRYWMLAELDPSIYYLSRASFDTEVTPRSAHDDLFTAITGGRAASDRLWLAMQHIEKATEIIDQNDLGFSFPVPGMMMKHYRPEPAPKWWKEAVDEYTNAMIEFYRSHDAADPRSRKLLYYYAKRSEYVLEYLTCVQAVRDAAIAKKAGDQEKAVEELEKAVESIYNAIDSLGDVVRDQSDRGLVAVLNNYAFKPLYEEYERMADEAP